MYGRLTRQSSLPKTNPRSHGPCRTWGSVLPSAEGAHSAMQSWVESRARRGGSSMYRSRSSSIVMTRSISWGWFVRTIRPRRSEFSGTTAQSISQQRWWMWPRSWRYLLSRTYHTRHGSTASRWYGGGWSGYTGEKYWGGSWTRRECNLRSSSQRSWRRSPRVSISSVLREDGRTSRTRVMK